MDSDMKQNPKARNNKESKSEPRKAAFVVHRYLTLRPAAMGGFASSSWHPNYRKYVLNKDRSFKVSHQEDAFLTVISAM